MIKLISVSFERRHNAKLPFPSLFTPYFLIKRLACLLAAAMLLGQSAYAANTSTWNNTGGGDWSTLGNWTGADRPPSAADTALFNAGTGTIIVVTNVSSNSITGISFDTASGSYTIGATGSGTLTLLANGTTQILSTLTATNAVETINAPILLGGNYTFANNSANGTGAGAGTLDFGGTITGSATSGTTTLTLSGSNTNANTISGVISNGAGTNVVAVTKSGAGTWTLSGANTYTGATTVSGGTLSLTGTLTGSSVVTSATTTTTGIVLESSTGVISGASAAFTQSSNGISVLAGNNTYGGATTVNAGTLDIGGSSSTGSITGSALVLGGGTLSYTTAGSGTQTFTGATFTAGQSTINVVSGDTVALNAISRSIGSTIDFGDSAGSVSTTSAGTNGILGGYATYQGNTWAVGGGVITGLANGSYTAATAGTTAPGATANVDFQASNSTAWATQTINSLRFNTSTAGTLTLSGTLIDATGGILVTSAVGNNLSTITGGTLEGANGQDLVAIVNDTGGLTIGSIIANNSSSTGLTKSGTGTLTLTAANTYTGATTVNAGTLILTGSIVSSSVTTSANTTGIVLETSSGVIGGASTTFTQSSNGTSVLAGNNTYGGATAVNSGTLTLSGSNSTSGVTVGGLNAVTVATLNINNSGAIGTGALTINAGSTIDNTSANPVTLGTNSVTFSSFVFGGTKDLNLGTGAVTDNSNTGAITLNGVGSHLTMGTFTDTNSGSNIALTVNGAGNTLTLGGYNISNGTSAKHLTMNGTANVGITGVVADSSSTGTGSNLIYSGTGTLSLFGSNTYSGGTTVNSGGLMVNNTAGSGTGTGAVQVNNGATLGGIGSINTSAVASGKAIDIASGATLSPSGGVTSGFSHLTLNLQSGSSVTLEAGSKLAFNLGSSTATSDEVLETGGTLALNGQNFSNFTFNAQSGTASGTYTLIDSAGGITGLLGTSLTGTFDGGLYTGTLFLNGNDLDLTVVAAAPEPGTWAMMLGGLGLLLIIQRRRNRLGALNRTIG